VNANPSLQAEPFGRLRLASPRTALALGVVTLLVVVAAVPLSVMSGATSSGLPLVPFGIVGYIVARRQPCNPIGWILLGLAFLFLLASDAGSYSYMAYRQGYQLPLARLAAFLAVLWISLLFLGPLPIALFPDGRYSRGWRWVVRAYLALATAGAVAYTWPYAAGIGARRIRVDSTGGLVVKGVSGWSGVVFTASVAALVSLYVASVIRLVADYRRATGEFRQQLKWLLSGAAISIGGLVLAVSGVIGGIGFFAVVALPIAMGVGILKYRLYDIDRLISRTLSYLIVTGLLAGVFIGIVVLTTRVLPFSSPVGVAASTLAAAALFNPLRQRVQRFVDRRFNRARYDAEAIVTAFTLRLRDAVDLDTVRGELLRAVNGAVQPAHASLWIRPPSSRSRV
jgi:hypothetical protein